MRDIPGGGRHVKSRPDLAWPPGEQVKEWKMLRKKIVTPALALALLSSGSACSRPPSSPTSAAPQAKREVSLPSKSVPAEEQAPLPLRQSPPDEQPTTESSAEVPAAAPEPPDDGSGCARDAVADAAKRWWDPLERGPARRGDFRVDKLPDLDGDGVEDQAVYSEFKGCAGMGGNCVNLVYLSRHGCAAYGGSFYGALHTLKVLPEARRGVHDIRILGQSGCAGRAGELVRLTFDGTSYKQTATVHCSCPDDNPHARRSPLCP